ncbi:MAG: MFS transporter [Sulfobacillus thermosulfidooxidans]|uniref:MFS transporter n=1 Tax=Sulfobacillus thermotolerans TaxID=338644 RepID=A0ABM6RS89_9FIRM|nr:MFS transporter [Sulfobacillus sp. hq2]AUW94209.1 MFS transporter [Sulfobacillus thermotolerans]MCY0907594.1 MFS transporter [Sulfobacillus thermotolerans]POB09522.1 MFS transporter [Sulfobacillus sp. hq2]PSR37352.1 MAG: MFS transporter [Sulfobacillus thermosulfidooxidans]
MLQRERMSLPQTLLLVILGLAEFARGALIISLLPAYVTGPLGASLTIVGWALSSHYFLDTVFRGPAGWLVDHIGVPRVLTIGLAIECLSLIGAMNTTQPAMIIVFVALLGVGTATHWPAIVTGTNRLTAPERRASMMGVVFAAWLTGSGLGPVLINFLLGGRDRTAFLLLVIADVVAFAVTIMVSDPRLTHIHEQHLKSHPLWKTLWRFRWVIPGTFVQNMTLGLMLPILQPFTTRVLHLSHVEFAELLLGSGAFTVILLVPMGKITDRFGLRVPLVGGFFVAGSALLGIAFFRHFFQLIVFGGILGLSYAMILPSWNAFLAELIPKEIEGWLWGVFMTIEGFGMSVGPILGTRLFAYRIWLPFVASAIILLIMGTFYASFRVQDKISV